MTIDHSTRTRARVWAAVAALGAALIYTVLLPVSAVAADRGQNSPQNTVPAPATPLAAAAADEQSGQKAVPAPESTPPDSVPTPPKSARLAASEGTEGTGEAAEGQNTADGGNSADGQNTGPPEPAPAAGTPSPMEEVTVTGTRIKRKDLESESPLVTVDSTQLEQKAGLNIESYLNQLPQYNPAQTPTTENQDVQPSAVTTVGISTISLYGLGPNRGLVLIDGHRTTPVNALMVTDVNSIPASMIDRVEIITGGASAIYGADAMSGVTNFLMKKSFQGAQIDVQDSVTQIGDGNELRLSALLGTKFSDGKGNFISGLEYYDRDAAYQKNRSFYTDSWTDPNATVENAFFTQGYNGYNTELAPPNGGAVAALFPQRAGTSAIYAYNSNGRANTYDFNQGTGTLWTGNGPLSTSGFTGATSGNGYGLVNRYDGTMPNVPGSNPQLVQGLKWNNPLATISEPQKRYSFFANGTYDITDNVQFYANARFADSLTTTLLDSPTTGTGGWDSNVPFNASSDSPINPTAVNTILAMPTATPAQQAAQQAAFKALQASFASNPSSTNPNYNPNYKALGTSGAQHPVPWQLALLLDSRGYNGVPGATNATNALSMATALYGSVQSGGAPGCFSEIAPTLCDSTQPGTTSWSLVYLPQNGLAQRTTVDRSVSWQIETGVKFPLGFRDWTGDVYYSRGESLNEENGYGSLNLQQMRAEVQSPGYGQGQTFQGNYNSINQYFGVSVPAKCTSGWYDAIFGDDVPASQDCLNGINAVLKSQTYMQQDNAELDLSGTLFKLPTGDVSAALGYEYRREVGQFLPDTLQSVNTFLTQTVSLYPTAQLQPNSGLTFNDFYAELVAPVASNLGPLRKLNLDIAGRKSDSDVTGSNTTFKVNIDASLGQSFHIRGGFNRAERAPNLGELYLGEQEYFGGGASFGDPCSVRSNAPFGAGGAAPDYSASSGAGTPKLASGQTAAGAQSTYLICQALMEAVGGDTARNTYYGTATQTALENQATVAQGASFGWVNEAGNPNLHPETANTWTGGFAFSNLGDNPWIAGLSGSVDWWEIEIKNAIELDSPDYASYLCYGTTIVTTPEQAAAQAATPACQNVSRLASDGLGATSLLTYTNQATINESGINLTLSWIGQLKDLGLNVPGAVTFSTIDENLNYYYTKQSPASFDVLTNWKGSYGPTLVGTDPAAFSYRLTANIGYQHPAFGVQLHWLHYPSTISTAAASQNAIIANNDKVAATGQGTMLSYTPTTASIASKAYSLFELSANWNVNKWLEIRGGINNLFNVNPVITNATIGRPTSTNLNAVCSAAAVQRGCVNPTQYSVGNDGAGQVAGNNAIATSAAYYDLYGRTFFIAFKATF